MLEMMLYGVRPGPILGDSAYRCRRCGCGPVMGCDGFLMDHCMNCGNWQGSQEPLNLGIGRALNSLGGRLVKATSKIFRGLRSARNVENTPELAAVPGN